MNIDLVETIKRISKLKVGETISSDGHIQDCSSWATAISRRYNRDNHEKTCNYIIELSNRVAACIESKQNNKSSLITLLPDFILAISRYIETCSKKWYAGDVETKLTECKNLLIKVSIVNDIEKKTLP